MIMKRKIKIPMYIYPPKFKHLNEKTSKLPVASPIFCLFSLIAAPSFDFPDRIFRLYGS